MLISTHVNTAHLLPRISVGCVMFFALAFCSILHATESETKEEKAPTTLSLEARILNAQQTLNKLNQALKENQQKKESKSILDKRITADQQINANPYSLAQHRVNYLLPFSYASNPNPIAQPDLNTENVDNIEAVFQISTKIPIYIDTNDALQTLSGLYFGFTARSFWQVFNDEVSKPFRETNYEPEIFYRWQADLSFFDTRFNALQIGLNHQSNGESGLRSRSWNRVIFSALFSDANSAYYIRTWWRIPEDEKLTINDPTGDDNPDINDYIGRIELGYAFQMGEIEVFTRLRNNLKSTDNRGSVQFNMTYPLSQRYDVLLQYFNGYGDSLIDYNNHQSRVSLGVQLRFL